MVTTCRDKRMRVLDLRAGKLAQVIQLFLLSFCLCVYVCVRACVDAWVRVCMRARVCVWEADH